MATLTLIGEPFPDAESGAHAEAVRELTQAVAETAPRGCSARLLVSSERDAPTFESARARVERLPLRSHMLPKLWRSGLTARPLDGEFVHSLTPLVPLRSRDEDDGSQSSVMVPHALGWEATDRMGSGSARQYRAFVKRAVRLADVVVTPTHAVADTLYERFGAGITVQVVPLAPPPSYLAAADSAERREALGLPARYIATTATACEVGRLSWVFDALEQDPDLPPVVVISGSAVESSDGATSAPGTTPAGPGATESSAAEADDAESSAADPTPTPAVIKYGAAAKTSTRTIATAPVAPISVPEAIRNRVHVVRPRELADVGAVISGAELLAVPQSLIGAGYEELAALAAGVPIVHGGCRACDELALDAGVGSESPGDFAADLARLTRDTAERERLSVFAEDRSRTFSWTATARLLWELHANI